MTDSTQCAKLMHKKIEKMPQLLQIRPKEFSIEYTGVIPEDLAVVLV
jgi:hypothetical protein